MIRLGMLTFFLVLVMAVFAQPELPPGGVPEPAVALEAIRSLYGSIATLILFVGAVVEMIKSRIDISGWGTILLVIVISQLVMLFGLALDAVETLGSAILTGLYVAFFAAGGYALIVKPIKRALEKPREPAPGG